MFLPYARQWITPEDIDAVCKVLQSDWLTTGPKVAEFEEKLAERTGARYAVTFSSGTAALHGACHAAGITTGDEIITSPLTFAATANAALYLGAKPVFTDIDRETGLINPALLEKAITPATKALVPVDYAGQPADMNEILHIARRHDLTVISDSAHALGATYGKKPTGSMADMTIFSFHPVKHIATGEGGAVTTNHPEYYRKLLRFRSHGVTRNPTLSPASSSSGSPPSPPPGPPPEHGPWYYEMEDLGYNYRLTDMQSALGISQLSKLDMFLEKRRHIAETYNRELNNLPGLSLPVTKPGRIHAWHLYVIRVSDSAAPEKPVHTKNSNSKIPAAASGKAASGSGAGSGAGSGSAEREGAVGKQAEYNSLRKALYYHLRENNIGSQVHYLPVYLHPYYRNMGYHPGLCPEAEKFYRECLSIPLFPAMTENDILRVTKAIRSFDRFLSR